ncbi:MAG: GntR family transcriptional regulator [Pseudomonadota bacterium]
MYLPLSREFISQHLTLRRRDQIAAEILLDVLSLELQPGERVFEDELARRFSISRTPVRDICSRLVAYDVLAHVDGDGMHVQLAHAERAGEVVDALRRILPAAAADGAGFSSFEIAAFDNTIEAVLSNARGGSLRGRCQVYVTLLDAMFDDREQSVLARYAFSLFWERLRLSLALAPVELRVCVADEHLREIGRCFHSFADGALDETTVLSLIEPLNRRLLAEAA